MIAILVIAGLVVTIAIAWANRLERVLPGMPVIGVDVQVPPSIASPRVLRRQRRLLDRERRTLNPTFRTRSR